MQAYGLGPRVNRGRFEHVFQVFVTLNPCIIFMNQGYSRVQGLEFRVKGCGVLVKMFRSFLGLRLGHLCTTPLSKRHRIGLNTLNP